MNYLTEIENKDGVNVVSSRVIASQLDKRHSDVLESIDKILANGDFRSLILLDEYKDKQGKPRKEYLLTKDGFTLYMFNIQGFNDFKIAYINEFNRMENELKNKLPSNYIEALECLLIAEKEKEQLRIENTIKTQQIGELKPKADYVDKILKSKSLMNVSQIAKDYGMSAMKFNSILYELKVQYKQAGQWLLYNKYHHKGYTHSETYSFTNSDGSTRTTLTTKWTNKGRLFLYELLKSNGYLPLIETE